MYFPFTPTQGQSFTLSISPDSTTQVSLTNLTAHISKDGGTYVNTSNSVTFLEDESNQYRGTLSVILTSTEMTANIIIVNFYVNGSFLYSVTIYTVASQATTINTYLPNVSEFTSFDNPTMQEVLSVMWQAMTLEASKKKWSFATFLQKWTF